MSVSAHHPPAYLARVPDGALARGPHLLDWLAVRGLERPTLLDLIAERARRAGRPVRSRGDGAAHALPMLGRADAEVEVARRNRARMRSALGGNSMAAAYRTGPWDPFADGAAA